MYLGHYNNLVITMSYCDECHFCERGQQQRIDLVDAAKRGDVDKVLDLINKCTIKEINSALHHTIDFKTIVALTQSRSIPYTWQGDVYVKAMIASQEAKSFGERTDALATCLYIKYGLKDVPQPEILMQDIFCSAYFGNYDLFEKHLLSPDADKIIKNWHTYIYSIACRGKCEKIMKYLESIPADQIDCYDASDYKYERCFWASYHDDRETWLSEAKNLISCGKEPHLYSWIDEVMFQSPFDRPHFVADKWYFFKMFFSLRIKMPIGYYHGYSLQFKVDWMTEFLERWFPKEFLVRHEDGLFEYNATWDGEGFVIHYVDNTILDEIHGFNCQIKNFGDPLWDCEYTLETLKDKLNLMNIKNDEIVKSKSSKILVDMEEIKIYF